MAEATAKDVMTKDIACISPDTSVRHAAAIMLARRVSGLPVIDNEGRLAGILTEGDLMRRTELRNAALAGSGSDAACKTRPRPMSIRSRSSSAPAISRRTNMPGFSAAPNSSRTRTIR